MLKDYKNGSSVKIQYVDRVEYSQNNREILKEYKGLLYKGLNKGNAFLLVSTTMSSDSYLSRRYNFIPNVYLLSVHEVREVSGTRFKKEVSEALNKQYNMLKEEMDLREKIDELEKRRNNLLKYGIAESSKMVLNVLSESNPNDLSLWEIKIKNMFKNIDNKSFNYDKNTVLNIYFNNLDKKGKNINMVLSMVLERNERLLSKEYEDRIRRDECVDNKEKILYTPSESSLIKTLGKNATIGDIKSDMQEQDKGWVSFYKRFEVKFPVNLEEVDKWYKKFVNHIESNYPSEQSNLKI